MNDANNINSINNMNLINNINHFDNMNNINNMNLNNMNFMNQMPCMNNMNNMNFINDMNANLSNLNNMMNDINLKNNNNINVYISFAKGNGEGEKVRLLTSPNEKVYKLIKKFRNQINDYTSNFKFVFNALALDPDLTISESEIMDNATIHAVRTDGVTGGGDVWCFKEINIKFIKVSKNSIYKNTNREIMGILKLCFLKEVSQKISRKKLKNSSQLIKYIMEILSNGYIEDDPEKPQKNISEVLKRMEGSNILNFSKFVDEVIDTNQINNILNLLSKEDFNKMIDIKYHLSKYVKYTELFNKEFEKSKKESIFEFSIISLVVIEREDFEIFEKEREKCPNRVEKILYHGTSVEPISSILTGFYRKSLERKKAINGKGVYFTDLLDYGWYYGGQDGNRANFSGIPKIGDTFTVIINSIYYDKNGFEKVKDHKRTPGKNQINFAYAGARSERLIIPDKKKFFAGEYVIYDLDQICPFMSATLKRVEYCVIWRDDNFSSKPIFNNKFDEIFKKFLQERLKYINQNAKYNIYPCETSEEALELVKRKRYNKIILISNVGKNLEGKNFIDQARKIIGNDVIALFMAYKISHLDWIKNYKNAIFSNQPKFYEDYLECFYDKYYARDKIERLIKKIEKFYGVKFNFNDEYLDYPNFKRYGKYGDLEF